MEQRKLIKICTVITSSITALSLGFRYLFPVYISSRFNIESFNLRNNSSIGIIGGADGPTAIYLSGKSGTNFTTAVFGLLSIAGIIYLIINKKAAK